MFECFNDDPCCIDRLVELLSTDAVGVIPADTIYGLSGVADDVTSERIFSVKERPASKNLIMLASLDWLASSPYEVPEVLYQHWPCPLTAIVRDRRDGHTQAIRVPADPFIQVLVGRVGPLWSTSVNLSGQPSLMKADEILRVFAGRIDFVVRKREEDLTALPSTLIDCTVTPFRVLRQGAYDASPLI